MLGSSYELNVITGEAVIASELFPLESVTITENVLSPDVVTASPV